MDEAVSAMKSDFGTASMMRKSVDLAKELDVDNVLVIKASLGSDERLKYQGYMIDSNKKEFKKSEAVFNLPEKGEADSSDALNQFNKALVDDPYEYKSISDLLMEEAEMLGLSENAPAESDKDSKEKKPVYKEWWLWTVVGVVVAGGVAAGVVCGLGKCTSGGGGSGATLDINFQ